MVMLVDFCFLPTSISLRRCSMNGGIFFARLLEASFLYKHFSKLALYLTYFFVYAQRLIQNPVRSSRLEVFCKKLFLKISQNSQENTCVRVSFFTKLPALGLQLN